MGFRDILTDACNGVARVGRLVTTFDGHPIQAKISSLAEYPATDKPLVVQIWGFKTLINTHSQFHGCSSYDGVVINSNGIGSNTSDPKNTFMNGRVFTSQVFVLSPEKMGISPDILKRAMVVESRKKNDYGFFTDNCIDHVIRPMQKAGAKLNLGRISTPRELSEWCEQAVNSGKGVLISADEYEKALKDKSSIVYQPPQQSIPAHAIKSR